MPEVMLMDYIDSKIKEFVHTRIGAMLRFGISSLMFAGGGLGMSESIIAQNWTMLAGYAGLLFGGSALSVIGEPENKELPKFLNHKATAYMGIALMSISLTVNSFLNVFSLKNDVQPQQKQEQLDTPKEKQKPVKIREQAGIKHLDAREPKTNFLPARKIQDIGIVGKNEYGGPVLQLRKAA